MGGSPAERKPSWWPGTHPSPRFSPISPDILRPPDLTHPSFPLSLPTSAVPRISPFFFILFLFYLFPSSLYLSPTHSVAIWCSTVITCLSPFSQLGVWAHFSFVVWGRSSPCLVRPVIGLGLFHLVVYLPRITCTRKCKSLLVVSGLLGSSPFLLLHPFSLHSFPSFP